MNHMFRYMLRQLLWPLFFAVFIVSGIIWMSQSLRFVDLVLNRGLPAYNMFYLAFLVLPMYTSVFLPIILFAVMLFAYTKMNQDSELVIWRSCGKGPLALAAPGLSAAVVVMILCYALNVYYMPKAYREFKDLQTSIRQNYSEILLREGAFNEVGRSLTIYVGERAANGELRGLLVYDRRDELNPVTMMAERGALVRTELGPRVIMVKGNRQTFKRTQDKLTILYFDRYTLDLSLTPTRARERDRQARERYLHELFGAGDSKGESTYEKNQRLSFLAEGHQRLAAPLLAMAFALIALVTALTGDFNRRGQGVRVSLACAVIVLVQTLNIGLYHTAATTPSVVPLMYLLPICAIGISLWLLLRSPRRSGTPALRGKGLGEMRSEA